MSKGRIDIPDTLPGRLTDTGHRSWERREGKRGHILSGPQEISSDPDPLSPHLNNIHAGWEADYCKQYLKLQDIKSAYQQGYIWRTPTNENISFTVFCHSVLKLYQLLMLGLEEVPQNSKLQATLVKSCICSETEISQNLFRDKNDSKYFASAKFKKVFSVILEKILHTISLFSSHFQLFSKSLNLQYAWKLCADLIIYMYNWNIATCRMWK